MSLFKLSAVDIVKFLKEGKYSCEEVIKSFIEQIDKNEKKVVHQLMPHLLLNLKKFQRDLKYEKLGRLNVGKCILWKVYNLQHHKMTLVE